MKLDRLGDGAYIARELPAAPYRVAEALSLLNIPGVIEIAPAWDTLGIYVDPDSFDPGQLPSQIELRGESECARHEVSVRFDGEDISSSAREVGLSEDQLVDIFCGAEYRCRCVGFQPGFPYLEGLPAPLNQLGRLASPRVRVPTGSVAIAAGQTGIYPAESPGGWRLLGVTDFQIRRGPSDFAISPGDEVKFVCV